MQNASFQPIPHFLFPSTKICTCQNEPKWGCPTKTCLLSDGVNPPPQNTPPPRSCECHVAIAASGSRSPSPNTGIDVKYAPGVDEERPFRQMEPALTALHQWECIFRCNPICCLYFLFQFPPRQVPIAFDVVFILTPYYGTVMPCVFHMTASVSPSAAATASGSPTSSPSPGVSLGRAPSICGHWCQSLQNVGLYDPSPVVYASSLNGACSEPQHQPQQPPGCQLHPRCGPCCLVRVHLTLPNCKTSAGDWHAHPQLVNLPFPPFVWSMDSLLLPQVVVAFGVVFLHLAPCSGDWSHFLLHWLQKPFPHCSGWELPPKPQCRV